MASSLLPIKKIELYISSSNPQLKALFFYWPKTTPYLWSHIAWGSIRHWPPPRMARYSIPINRVAWYYNPSKTILAALLSHSPKTCSISLVWTWHRALLSTDRHHAWLATLFLINRMQLYTGSSQTLSVYHFPLLPKTTPYLWSHIAWGSIRHCPLHTWLEFLFQLKKSFSKRFLQH